MFYLQSFFVDDTIENRKRVAEKYCHFQSNGELLRKSNQKRMQVFDNRIAFCRVNKCGTTFTLDNLEKMIGCPEKQRRKCAKLDVKYLNKLLFAKKHKTSTDLYSFFFVREPYRRLFSTYSNKFYLPKEHWAPIGPYIARHYRKSPSKESLAFGHDVTFQEMIQYTVDVYEKGGNLDEHLKPMFQMCNPCRINFDYIGKLETINQDWDHMLNLWSKTGIVDTSFNNSRVLEQRTKLEELRHIETTIELLNNSRISRYNLFLRGWTYYQITGRILKRFPMPFSEQDTKSIKFSNFKDAIIKAMEDSKAFEKMLKQQKEESILQAYSTISDSLLERLRKVVLVDCKLFGYDDRPVWLFGENRTVVSSDFDFFKGI